MMNPQAPALVPTLRQRSTTYVRRGLDAFALLVMHELDALEGHVAEARERIAVARSARGLGDLLRTQLDLVPETRARLTLNARERRALLNGWMQELKALPRLAA